MKKEAPESVKKPYQTPVLKVLGDVQELTRSNGATFGTKKDTRGTHTDHRTH